MNEIIDFIRLLKINYNTDVIHFEKIIQNETGKYCEIFIEDEKIVMYHKVTGSKIGIYSPSPAFCELANAFITKDKPSLKLYELTAIKPIFEKHKIKITF